MKNILIILALAISQSTTSAAAKDYTLSTSTSAVNFVFEMAGNSVVGTLPVTSSQIEIDPVNLDDTRFEVTLDARRATAGLPPISEAIRGPSVLDANRFDNIAFRTVRATREGDKVKLIGELTIRGVTRPIVLDAAFFLPEDAEPGDYSKVSLSLKGRLNRHDFGASGFRAIVDENVVIDIRARLTAAN